MQNMIDLLACQPFAEVVVVLLLFKYESGSENEKKRQILLDMEL